MHRRPIDRHSRARIGIGVEQLSRVPIGSPVSRAEIVNTRAIAARARLTAEYMHRIAGRDDVGPPYFLARQSDPDGVAPTGAVIGGFAEVQRLAGWSHVARRDRKS